MKAIILNVLGRYSNGILILIGLTVDNKFYNAIFFYNHEEVFIEVEDDFLNNVGIIEEHIDYENVIQDLLSKSPPYEDILDIEEIDINDLKNND
jgi:hypothetical protein